MADVYRQRTVVRKSGGMGGNMDLSDPGPGFIFFRIVQIITLIVCWSLLAAVVSAYNHAGLPVPGAILCLFIVGILATVWSFCILLVYLQANNVDFVIVFFDFVAMVALIVGVALLTNAVDNECVNVNAAAAYAGVSPSQLAAYLQSTNRGLVAAGNYGSYCKLLRAAWGLGIANIVFFFLTTIQGAQIAASFQQRLEAARYNRRTSRAVEEEVIAQPVIIEETSRPRRKKSSKHKHRSSRDREKRRSSRGGADYYAP